MSSYIESFINQVIENIEAVNNLGSLGVVDVQEVGTLDQTFKIASAAGDVIAAVKLENFSKVPGIGFTLDTIQLFVFLAFKESAVNVNMSTIYPELYEKIEVINNAVSGVLYTDGICQVIGDLSGKIEDYVFTDESQETQMGHYLGFFLSGKYINRKK